MVIALPTITIAIVTDHFIAISFSLFFSITFKSGHIVRRRITIYGILKKRGICTKRVQK